MGSRQPQLHPNSGIAAAYVWHYSARMDMNEAVAKAISAERSIADLTVRELAAASGIPERSLMRVLTAERDIKVNQVADLAAALRVYPHEILEHAEQILARSRRDIAEVVTLRPPSNAGSGDDSAGRFAKLGSGREFAEGAAAHHDEVSIFEEQEKREE